MSDEVFPDEIPETDPLDEMELTDLAAAYAREALKEMRERPKIGLAFSPSAMVRPQLEHQVILERADSIHPMRIQELLDNGYSFSPVFGGTIQVAGNYLLLIGARERKVQDNAQS